jgi:hypothetical protein
VDFYPLDVTDEDSINAILYQADIILQYLDNQEPREEYYRDKDYDMDNENDNEEMNQESNDNYKNYDNYNNNDNYNMN